MSTICAQHHAVCPVQAETPVVSSGFGEKLMLSLRRAIFWLSELEDRRLSRLALSELTDDQLADIGITAQEARREAARPFWA